MQTLLEPPQIEKRNSWDYNPGTFALLEAYMQDDELCLLLARFTDDQKHVWESDQLYDGDLNYNARLGREGLISFFQGY